MHFVNGDTRADCPSGNYASGIQCPCLPGSWSRKIVVDLSYSPTLILANSNLFRNWEAEFATFVDSDPDSGMVINLRDYNIGHDRLRAVAQLALAPR